jgi:hypothetical protein
MSPLARASVWISTTIAALLIVASVVLLAVSLSAPQPEQLFSHRGANTLNGAPLLALGLLIVMRRPGNVVGLTILVMGQISAVYGLATEYGIYALGLGVDPVGGAIAAWLVEWTWIPLVNIAMPFLFLVFPTGQLPSPRWRIVVLLAVAIGTAQAAVFAFHPGPLRYLSYATPNPFAIEGAAPLLATVEALTVPLSSLVFALALAGVIVRARRAATVERRQIKWLALAAAVAAISYSLAVAFRTVEAFEVLVTLSGITMTAACAVAILRHRLFDIDRIVDNTITYGAVTVILVATYAAAVVLLQNVLRPFTAGSDLAVAVSTLLVVALFHPIRRRVQDLIDRRFYRSRYDAARTLDAFTARLRDEVDIDSVRADLLGAVRDTVRPAQASLWLREVRR